MLTTAGEHAVEAARIVHDVFAEMLRLDVSPTEDVLAAPGPEGILSAAVYFAGPWRGGAILECLAHQAEDFAQRLLPEGIELTRDDVRDSLGEIINMVAGNFKAVLPDGSAISMPSVVEGSDYTLRVCGGRIVTCVAMRCEVGAFRVLIAETEDR